MNLKSLLGLGIALACIGGPAAARADKLIMQQNVEREQRMSLPTRGMSMGQVERQFGAPVDKLSSAGGDAPKHPTINRWRYNGYTVYFEREHVIHAVADGGATPKPTT